MRSALILLLLSFAALACAPVSQARVLHSEPSGTAPATQPAPQPQEQIGPVRRAAHVLVISLDGLRPDLLARGDAPHLRSLLEKGSYTLWARTTPVSITLPSHVSMMTGVEPEVHGISFNGDPPEGARITVPTLFDLARNAGLTTMMAAGKSKFTLFSDSGHVDWYWSPTESVCADEKVIEQALPMILEHKPDLMFVHLPGLDSAGHGNGWGSRQQVARLARIDALLGRLLDTLEEAGIAEQTLLIVSADHGGSAKGHGPDDVRSRTIPWIAVGPGVRPGFDLTGIGKEYDVQTYDTFATAADALGLAIPEGITGKPIVQIWAEAELMGPSPK